MTCSRRATLLAAGHADFHIHSGEGAAILPQQVAFFARRQVVKVAAAKHHTAAITSVGELFTWGSNRDGRLGYQAIDTQPTPRKITAFNRQKVAAVAVANRHTVALLEGGVVFSWGSNLQGQLGYGTSDSGSNALPRIVEAMKGKIIKAVAAAKRHTVVLTAQGDVYTWGHKVVTPKRVSLTGAREGSRAGEKTGGSNGWEVVFHRGQSDVAKPVAVAIAAGAAHSSAVTRDGVVLAWRSMDPALRPQEIGGPLSGKIVTAISAGKYRTAAVTSEGDVYMWEGWSKAAEAIAKRSHHPLMTGTSPPEALPPEWEVPWGVNGRKPGKARALAFQLITPQRVDGMKRATGVAVGEKHSIALQSWSSAPAFHVTPPAQSAVSGSPAATTAPAEAQQLSPRGSEASVLDDSDWNPGTSTRTAAEGVASDAYWEELEEVLRATASNPPSPERTRRRPGSGKTGCHNTLQRLCERCVAESMVEPRTTLQILEYADAAGAQALRQHCMGVALSNLDLVLLESRGHFEQLLPHILAAMEQQWSLRFPRAITAPACKETKSWSPSMAERSPASTPRHPPALERSFKNAQEQAESIERAKQERTVRKKLQQIEVLERRGADGQLDTQQRAKLALRPTLNSALQALQNNRPLEEVKRLLTAAQSPAPATPKTVPQGGTPLGSQSERRQRSRRSRSGLSSSGTSPIPGSSYTGHQEASWPPETSPSSSQNSLASRFSESHLRAGAESTVPNSVPRIAGFQNECSTQAFRRPPISLQGFAEPLSAPQSRPQGSVNSLATLLEESGGPGRNEGFEGSAKTASSGSKQVTQGSPAERITTPSSSGKKAVKRKGGLSMFLSGQLEPPAPDARPAAAPAKSPLTWAVHGQALQQPTASLKDIQDQEAAQSSGLGRSTLTRGQSSHRAAIDNAQKLPGKAASGVKQGLPLRQSGTSAQMGRHSDEGSASSGITVSLGDLVKKSKPIAVAKTAEKGAPAWGNVPGESPPPAHTRLQDIQAEQEHARESLSRSWGASGASPGSHKSSQFMLNQASWRFQSPLSGAPGTSPGGNFPAGTSPSSKRGQAVPQLPQNKWYIKEEPEIVPLRSIQTEESAIKELSELYGAGNVRVLPRPRNSRS